MAENDVRIALAADGAGNMTSVPDSERIVVYGLRGGAWEELSAVDFSFAGASGLCGMRKRLSEYMDALGDVQAVLARGFPGVCRDVLSRNGYVLYETDVFEREVLDGILEHLESGSLDGEDDDEAPVVPREKEPGSGEYFIDLRKALNANPDLTTKKILRPFLKEASFLELSFIYDHFPPWLPQDLLGLGLKFKSEDSRGGVLVTVWKEGAGCRQPEL